MAKGEIQKGMLQKGDKMSPEARKKLSETKKKKAAELRDAKIVAKEILAGGGMETMLGGLWAKASDGNVEAAKLLLKLTGMAPVDNTVSVDANMKIEPITGIEIKEKDETNI